MSYWNEPLTDGPDRAAQRRCGKRGHWQAVEAGTGQVVSPDCIYCGSRAYNRDGLTKAMVSSVCLMLLAWCAVIVQGVLWLAGVGA